VLQRNGSDHPLDVMAIPATVQPGDTIDWPDPIVGFEPVKDEPKPTRKTSAKAGEETA
jgi:hypothetical protein